MFDKNYYEGKKQKLEEKRIGKMGKVIQDMTNLMNGFYADINDLQERLKELQEIENNSKKAVEPKEVKPKEVKKSKKK